MNYVRNTYVFLQIDVNMRQADNMAKILRNLLDRGESPEKVISDFQASIQGSETDRGYLCMIDRGGLLCYPNPELALDMQHYMDHTFHDRNKALSIRIGIHTGPAVAGVVGRSKFVYDLWGETVNLASRLETTCGKDKIHISRQFMEAAGESFIYEECGSIKLKGLGIHKTWFLSGCRK